jgi:hypothetical protein
MVGWHKHFGGIVDELVGPLPNLAFVRHRAIENSEERLISPTLFPMRLSRAFIPGLAVWLNIVVLFRIIGAVIARLPEVERIQMDVLG